MSYSIDSQDELAATRPLLAETNERRNELPRLGLRGLQSLGYIEANAAPPPDWTAAEKELLKNAADHTEMVDFVVLTPLKKLFDTASKP
jgi:hypothetical protein